MTTNKAFSATLKQLPEILRFVRTHLEQTSLPKPEQMRFELAMEEAIVNVILHADADTLTLIVLQEQGQIAFEILDTGSAFNPLTHPIQEDEAPLEELEPGGKGLLLMRKCSDALLYRREDGQNVLTIVKKLVP